MQRAEWLAGSLSRSRPWEARGMSRASWYRHGKPAETGPEQRETGPLPETGARPETGPPAGSALPLITSSYGPGYLCAQCNGLSDGLEREVIVGSTRVLLHRECERFYERSDTRHPNVSGGWG